MSSVNHPSRDELKAFLDGQLSDEDQRRIEAHVEGCEVCCGVLREIRPDSLREQFGLPRNPDELGRTREPDSDAAGEAGDREALERKSAERTPRGLHVRCPHCHNPIELVPDAPLVDICCPVCGSWFSLVDDEHATRGATSITRVGHFELIDRLGMGAFGSVWKARDTILDRTVAVKIPRKGQLEGDEAERFLREARAAAQLHHRHIVPVHEVGRDGELLYIVTDLVRGVPLSEKLARQRLTQREVAVLLAKVADGLQHAHEVGVIHRDLKPHNVMIDAAGEPQIMDFGLAKREAGEITMTIEGVPLGTPAYMPPEQVEGQLKQIDRRSDVYSLGVMMFQMLTGELPFRGTRQMVMHQKLTQEPPTPRSLDGTIRRDMETICLKCLERDRDRRYATAADVRDDLRRFSEGKPIQAQPVSRLRRWYANNPARAKALVSAFVAMMLITTAAVVVGIALQRQNETIEQKNDAANRRLYRSLIGEARALISSKQQGSGSEALRLLSDALKFPTSDKAELRKLAAESMTDGIEMQRTLGSFDDNYRPVCMSTSQTGAFAVAGFHRGRCRVYDLANGELLGEAVGDNAEVRAVRLVAEPGEKEMLIYWVTVDGHVYTSSKSDAWQSKLVENLEVGPLSDYQIEFARFSANGRYLTAILGARRNSGDSLPRKNRVWRTSDWMLIDDRPVHPDSQSSCVDDDGSVVACSYNNSQTNGYLTFSTESPGCTIDDQELDLGALYRESFSMSADGSLLVFGCRHSLVVNLPSKTTIADFQRSEVRMSAISSDKRLAAFCYVDGVIEVLDIRTNRIVATLFHDAQRQKKLARPSLAFSGDSRFLVATNVNFLTIWRIDSERTTLAGHPGGTSCLAYSADGRMLMSGGHDDVVRVWDLEIGRVVRVLQCGAVVQSLRLSADGKWLATGARGSDKPCQIWSTETWHSYAPEHTEDLGPVSGVAFTRYGNDDFLAGAGSNGMSVWKLKRTDNGGIAATLYFHRDVPESSQHLNIGSENIVTWITGAERLNLWDLRKYEYVNTSLKVIRSGWNGVHFFPDGDLAFVNPQGVVERRTADGGKLVDEYGEKGNFVSPLLAISHGGRFIAGVTPTSRVVLWDATTKTRLFDLPVIGEPWSLAWHPDNDELAIGSSTGHLVRWHVKSIRSRLRSMGLDWD